MLNAGQLITTVVMTFFGATVFSTVGFGIGVSTFPVLFLIIDPQTAIVVVNTVSLGLFGLVIWQTRASLPLREIGPVALAGLAGVPLGVFILGSANESLLRIVITGLIIVLALVALFNLRGPIPKSNFIGIPVGFVTGIMLTGLGIGGALMALFALSRNWQRQALRGALAFYFLLVEFSGVVGYGIAGLITTERILLILVAIVPVVLGFRFATILVRRMNETAFRRAVISAIIASSLLVLAREVANL